MYKFFEKTRPSSSSLNRKKRDASSGRARRILPGICPVFPFHFASNRCSVEKRVFSLGYSLISNMKITKIPQLGIRFIQNIPGVITLGEDFAIFDDLNAIPVLEHPIRIEALAFSMCLKGHMELSLDMEHYSIAPGDIILIRPNNILQHISHSDDLSAVFIAMNVHSTLDIISLIKRTLPPTYHYMKEAPLIHLNDQERQCVSEYYRLLKAKAAATDNPMRREIIVNILRAMIYDLIYISQQKIPQSNTSKGREDQLTELFIRQMENSFREHRDVAYYADKLCLTPKYLSQMVKKATGRTAGQWIDYRVILEAKTLLQATDMTVQQISQELNFPNQSFFGKYFKNLTGISPQKYRKG